LVSVPVFQKLERVVGNWDEISARLTELSVLESQAWLEIVYEGDEVTGDLREQLEAAISGSSMQILRLKNSRIIDRVLSQIQDDETLDDLNINDVFIRCLEAHKVPDEQRPELIHAYQEILASLYENDSQAE
jgi:exonuclease SbcD